jgi:nanoRNase/pAp phosphatase (c-di-AMP/oligoRNAs hydrolase)
VRCITVHDNLVVLNLRREETISPSMYGGACNSKTHVGELMLQFGGGSHNAAGTGQMNNKAAKMLQTLIKRINANE